MLGSPKDKGRYQRTVLKFEFLPIVVAKGCLRRLKRYQAIFDFILAIQSWFPKAFLQKPTFYFHLLGAGVTCPTLTKTRKFAAKSSKFMTKILESWRRLQQVCGHSALAGSV